MMLTFNLPGIPIAKQSFRFKTIKKADGKSFVSKYQTSEIVQNQKALTLMILSQIKRPFNPFTCPLSVFITFVFPPLKSWNKQQMEQFKAGVMFYKDTAPDIDNCTKQVLDAMADVVYVNDSRIVKLSVSKIYGKEPKTIVEIGPVLDLYKSDAPELPIPVNENFHYKNNANHYGKDKPEEDDDSKDPNDSRNL